MCIIPLIVNEKCNAIQEIIPLDRHVTYKPWKTAGGRAFTFNTRKLTSLMFGFIFLESHHQPFLQDFDTLISELSGKCETLIKSTIGEKSILRTSI